MENIYEFIEELKNNNYKCSLEELKSLVEYTTNSKDYRTKKLEKIAENVCNLDHAGYWDVDSTNFGPYIVSYSMTFFIGEWIISFRAYFNNGEELELFSEISDKNHYEAIHGLRIGNLSVEIIALILNLFEKHGKYANIDNPDIATLFNNYKNSENVKSARTVL